MLLVCRFGGEVTRPDEDAFLTRGRRALALLAAQPGCERVELARAVEAPGEWVLVAVFASVDAYRRALSPFDVREHVVPWLAQARTDAPATFERRVTTGAGGGGDPDVVDLPSILG